MVYLFLYRVWDLMKFYYILFSRYSWSFCLCCLCLWSLPLVSWILCIIALDLMNGKSSINHVHPICFVWPLSDLSYQPSSFNSLWHQVPWFQIFLPTLSSSYFMLVSCLNASRTKINFYNRPGRFFIVWHPLTSDLILIFRITSACHKFLCSSLILKTKHDLLRMPYSVLLPAFVPPLWVPCWAGSIAVPWFLCAP